MTKTSFDLKYFKHQVHRYAGCCIIWMELDQRLVTGNLQTLLNTTRFEESVLCYYRSCG